MLVPVNCTHPFLITVQSGEDTVNNPECRRPSTGENNGASAGIFITLSCLFHFNFNSSMNTTLYTINHWHIKGDDNDADKLLFSMRRMPRRIINKNLRSPILYILYVLRCITYSKLSGLPSKSPTPRVIFFLVFSVSFFVITF